MKGDEMRVETLECSSDTMSPSLLDSDVNEAFVGLDEGGKSQVFFGECRVIE